ncbi:MAG: cation diffusion facilitator family transporter [Clostridiales bacterium]|nr:cation diffusion facilitator family transporter [Clostridiales bacterium]
MIRKFVDERATGDMHLKRLLCGRLSGTVGILIYAFVGIVKIFVGLATGSVAVMADAVHNLADAGASIATLVGFTLANKKSDAEHPYGHARFEYMTGVVVSGIIIGIGIKMITSSYDKIVNPTMLETDTLSIVLLVITALVPLWFFRFNFTLSGLIGSASLRATGVESRNDVVATLAVLGAILVHHFAGVNIDGYAGLAVSVFIIYSGIKTAIETAGPLLGQSPDPDTVREIADFALKYDGVLGIHDLIVHDYGPGHVFASVHIEVDGHEDIFNTHSIVDDIEKDALSKLSVQLVGHLDPVDTKNPRVRELSETLAAALSQTEGIRGIHDLRIVVGPLKSNVIFDVVTTHDDPDKALLEVERIAQGVLRGIDPSYVAVISCDLEGGGAHRGDEPA